MAAADGARWNARYAARDPGVTPAPPDALVDADMVGLVPTSGRALDVACGLGAQTIWMAQRGLDVTALDISDEAVNRLGGSARRSGVDQRVTAMCLDLDAGLPGELTGFDVIVCQRFRDPRLHSQFVERLAPGGLLVVTVLSVTGAESSGPFHAPSGELRAAFDRAGRTMRFHAERDGEESVVVSIEGVGSLGDGLQEFPGFR